MTINLGKTGESSKADPAKKPEGTAGSTGTSKPKPTDKPGVTTQAYDFNGYGPKIELIENADNVAKEEKAFENLDAGSGGQVTFDSGDTVYGYKLDDLSIVGVKVNGQDKTEVRFFLDKPLKINDETTLEAGIVKPEDYVTLTETIKDGGKLSPAGLPKLPAGFREAIRAAMQKATDEQNKPSK